MLTNKENKSPCWRKPEEVTEPGLYVVIELGNTEPGSDEPPTYVFYKEGNTVSDKHNCPITDPFYRICRFFGPIPTYKE